MGVFAIGESVHSVASGAYLGSYSSSEDFAPAICIRERVLRVSVAIGNVLQLSLVKHSRQACHLVS